METCGRKAGSLKNKRNKRNKGFKRYIRNKGFKRDKRFKQNKRYSYIAQIYSWHKGNKYLFYIRNSMIVRMQR